MLSRHQEEKKINLYAENTSLPRDQEGTGALKDGSKAMYGLGSVSDIQVCNKTRKIQRIEVKVPSFFEDQTEFLDKKCERY